MNIFEPKNKRAFKIFGAIVVVLVIVSMFALYSGVGANTHGGY